jgi:AcrR family transcriptional regulator
MDVSPSLGSSDASFQSLARRRRILGIAREQFGRRGVEGTTLADIAFAARLAEYELTQHFHSKTELLMAVFDEGWAPIVDRLADVADGSKSARDAVVSMLTAMLQLSEKDPAFTRLLLFESHRIEPGTGKVRMSNGYRRFIQLCIEVAERGQRDGSFRTALHPRLIVSALINAVQGLLRDKVLADAEGPSSPYTALDALTTGLRP